MRKLILPLLLLYGAQIQARAYDLKVPKSYTPDKSYPLIVFLHGFGSQGSHEKFYVRLSRVVNKTPYILALPNGTKDKNGRRFWNVNDKCCDFDQTGVDDVGYITELIKEVKRDYSIKPDQIFLFGHSNGAMLAYRIACEVPEDIAGIVSYAGVSDAAIRLCKDKPMKVLHIHGTEDETILYEGTEDYPSARGSLAYWIEHNQCTRETYEHEVYNFTRLNGGAETDVVKWRDCRTPGADVTLWKIKGAGHANVFYKNFPKIVLQFLTGRGMNESLF